jgi:hypothetical protein
MRIFHHHTPQTSLNVTLTGAPKDGAIVRSIFIQHSWWHGCKLSRMTKKVICNFRFLKKNNNCPFFHHYTLSSFFFVGIFCGVMCMCYLSPITFSYICCLAFFKELWNSRFEVWIFIVGCHFRLLVSSLNAFAFAIVTTSTAMSPFYFYYLLLPWHLFCWDPEC